MTQQLISYAPNGTGLAPQPAPALNLGELTSVGKILAESGFFNDAKGAAQAIAKVLAGAELGIGPVASMTGVNIINGKIALSANLVAALIRKSRPRYDYRIVEQLPTSCTIAFLAYGQELGRSVFTLEDAKAASLAGGNWAKYPRNMLFSRAMTNGARWYCPDIFVTGVYTADELGADVDGETGEIRATPPPDALRYPDSPAAPPARPMREAEALPPHPDKLRAAFYAAAADKRLTFKNDPGATREAINQYLGLPLEEGVLSGMAARFGWEVLKARLEAGEPAIDLWDAWQAERDAAPPDPDDTQPPLMDVAPDREPAHAARGSH